LKHLYLPLIVYHISISQEPLSMDIMNTSSNSPQQSIEGRPVLQRQSSTSSSSSAESSHTRPRKAVRSTKRRTSASGPQAPEEERSGSRRGSISSMRTSSAPLEGPITYTPTTHRISKAKKGKRVHNCEFPGCNKVCLVQSSACSSLTMIDLHTSRAPETT
jgi:hypothetical protein